MRKMSDRKDMMFSAKDRVWNLSEKALVMGVINVTPDSFSDGGEYLDPHRAQARAIQFERDGADILDLGAESSRPGAASVSWEEELRRLLPVLKAVREVTDLPVSIDTTKSRVADEMLRNGACMINDVSGLRADPAMPAVIACHQAGIILMHRRGDSLTMQEKTQYGDLIFEIKRELKESIDTAIDAGISYDRMAVDPGIGFAKTKSQNLSLIRWLEEFLEFELPIVIGVSRKSFIGEITKTSPKERVFGTAAAVALSVFNGAKIIRVHDVKEMREVVEVTEAVLKAT